MTVKRGPRSRAVTAAGGHWHGALAACLDQLEPMPAAANLGFVYISEALAPMADTIVRALRDRTGVASWMGACGAGILGGPAGSGTEGIAALVVAVPSDAVRLAASPAQLRGCNGLVLAHAEIGPDGPRAVMGELTATGARTIAGGLTALGRSPVQIAGDVMAGTTACLAFAPDHPAFAGLATAGSPLGPGHRVTSALEGEILALDGRPALAVLTEELGDLFRHAGERFAPNLWVADRSSCGEGLETLRMRRIVAVDQQRGSLRVDGGRLGTEVRLMRPDPAGSLARVRDLGRAQMARLGDLAPVAGIYLASRHRGRGLFGP